MKLRLLLSSVVLAYSCQLHAQVPQANSVYVAGKAVAEVAPDTCTVRVLFESAARDKSRAIGEIQDSVKKLASAAINEGTSPSGIEASDQELRTETSEKGSRTATVQRRAVITTNKVEACPRIADAALKLSHVHSVTLYFTAANSQDFKDKMLIEAAADARRKAQKLATYLGRQLGRATSISEEPFTEVPGFFSGDGPLARPGEPGQGFIPQGEKGSAAYRQPSKIAFSKSVYVVFELE
jgi:uncharacterized protein YggE